MHKKITYVIAILFILVFKMNVNSQVFNIVVDKSGRGDYITIQDAINSVPNYLSKRTLIFVRKGLYKEKVVVSSSKTNVSLIGEDTKKVIISWDDYQGKDGISGANSYTLWLDSPGFYAENITVENTSGDVGQAIAIRTTGDTMVFNNCRFVGFQDTYYAHKRKQYNYNCYLEGATDFIYGDATAVFDSCTINCVKGGQYITAPADTKFITQLSTGRFLHGLLFRNCRITANDDVQQNSYYLGRPWQPNASSVFYDCKLGEHIKPEGWSKWGATDNHESSVFAEHKSVSFDGSLIDVSDRAYWSYQLNNELDTLLYGLNFFLKQNWVIWNPRSMVKALPAPINVAINESNIIWDRVENAIGYLVLADDSVIGVTESTNFNITGLAPSSSVFAVRSVNKNGNLSIKSSDIPTTIEGTKLVANKLKIIQVKKDIKFSGKAEYKVFTIHGKIIKSGISEDVDLNDLKSGIYIIRAISKQGEINTKKILI